MLIPKIIMIYNDDFNGVYHNFFSLASYHLSVRLLLIVVTEVSFF
ncbi:hypothetical protein VCSRO136_2497 [Vibrio cholerae]|nr:hypothetical protein VCSRO136_2497 [Vibrio cholerae]